MNISIHDWQQFKDDRWTGVGYQERSLRFDYPFAFIVPRIAEGLCFWKFVLACSSASEFTGWRQRRDELKQFMSDDNVFVRMIAMIESMPDSLWRAVLWKYNIDFMSLESFLRRITPEQVRQIEDNFNDLYVDGVLPRAYGFVQRKIKGLSTLEILSEEYDYDRRMMSKGSMSFDLLNLNFGFGKYPNGDNDDMVNVEISPLRFLSVKSHVNDFVVNQENGRYWWMYRVARSNLLWNASKTIQLKPHICPGFWLTMLAHLFFWVISPMCAVSLLPLLLMKKLTVYHIPLVAIGAFTPVFCLLAFCFSSLGEGVVEMFAKVFGTVYRIISYPIRKIYEWDSKLLDCLFSVVLHFVGFISFPFIYTLYFDTFFEKVFDDYPQWAFYLSTLAGYIVVGILVIMIHGSKCRYRHTAAGYLAALSSLAMIIPSVVLQLAGAVVCGISWVLYKMATEIIWQFILRIAQHLSDYYAEYAMFIGGFAAFTVLMLLGGKMLDAYCMRIEAERSKKQVEVELDLIVGLTNLSIYLFAMAILVISAVSFYSLFTIGAFAFGALPNYSLAAIIASGLFGLVYLKLVKMNVTEKKPIVKHLHEIIDIAQVDSRWHGYALNLGLNPDFIRLKKKDKIQLLKKANELMVNYIHLRNEEKVAAVLKIMSLHMDQDGISELSNMRNWSGLKITEIMRIVLVDKRSASQAIRRLRERDEQEETKIGIFELIGSKIKEYGLTLYRLYELFNERCPYIAKSKVLHL